MESLISNFLKSLKIKLLYKTSGHMTEEVLLLRNFKYFDEDETKTCAKETFLKVMAKVGVLSLSEEELIKVFNYYSKGKKYLNYKDFVAEIYNNESLRDKANNGEGEEKEENEEKNEKANCNCACFVF